MNFQINKIEAKPAYRKVATISLVQKHSDLDIKNYSADGFEKVCDVVHQSSFTNYWNYAGQNTDLLYSPHRSWVYTICVEDQIVKIGETGNPLGIKNSKTLQPITGTTSRLGRYRQSGDTDLVIREALSSFVTDKKVSIWARKCDVVTVPTVINGKTIQAKTAYHKDLEGLFLDHIKDCIGRYPILNKGRA